MPSSTNFIVSKYELSPGKSGLPSKLIITGSKIGQPNFRFTLKQQNLKITSADITYLQRGKRVDITTKRINHLKTINEVRLHSSSILYPGNYSINLTFVASPKIDYSRLDKKSEDLSEYFPVIRSADTSNKPEIIIKNA